MAFERGAPAWRMFLAAPVPQAASDELWAALLPLQKRHPNARWAKLDQLHATLVFLGQTAAEDVPRLEGAIGTAAAHHAPFEVGTGEAGGRVDDRRGGVCWLRLDRGARQLSALALEVDRLCGTDAYDGSSPRPHITVARRIDEDLLADLRATAPQIHVAWMVDRITLMRSHPEPGGSRYETLASRLLTAAPATA